MLKKAEWTILVLFAGLAVSTTVWAMWGDGGTLATAGALQSKSAAASPRNRGVLAEAIERVQANENGA